MSNQGHRLIVTACSDNRRNGGCRNAQLKQLNRLGWRQKLKGTYAYVRVQVDRQSGRADFSLFPVSFPKLLVTASNPNPNVAQRRPADLSDGHLEQIALTWTKREGNTTWIANAATLRWHHLKPIPFD